MTEDEKYLFDLNGYLVIDNVLNAQELALANEGIDRHAKDIVIRQESLAENSSTLIGQHGRGECGTMMTWDAPWGPLFRGLLTHPRLVPYLNEVLGKGFRVDHPMFLLTMDKGTEGFHFHGKTGPDWDPAEYYFHRNGKIYCGLTVMSIQLTDVNPGDGGFGIVPGSHKANFLPSSEMLRYQRHQDQVRQICCRAGSAVMFTEAVTHGTLPWRSDKPRRTLLTRYNRSTMAYVPASPAPEWADERTKVVMQPPSHWRTGHKELPE